MTKLSAKRATAAAVLTGAILCSTSAFASIVYDNSTTSLGRSYSPGNGIEFGDEIFLGGTDRTITEFRFETFTSSNASGNETAQIIFRLNNGANLGTGRIAPGAEIGRSPVFSLGQKIKNATETHIWSGISISLGAADNYTWSVVINGIDAGENVGLALYNPPTVGLSYDDFWRNDAGTGWNTYLIDGGATIANFAARITAVPEPSTLVLGALGGAALLGFLRIRRRS